MINWKKIEHDLEQMIKWGIDQYRRKYGTREVSVIVISANLDDFDIIMDIGDELEIVTSTISEWKTEYHTANRNYDHFYKDLIISLRSVAEKLYTGQTLNKLNIGKPFSLYLTDKIHGQEKVLSF